jgi:hypothetical protein
MNRLILIFVALVIGLTVFLFWERQSSPQPPAPADSTADSIRWRDALRESDLRLLASALELYRADFSSYPETSGDSSEVLKILVPKHLANIPRDPSGRLFYYEYNPKNGGYVLCAATEGEFPENSALTVCRDKNCGETCNYELKSPR